MYDIFVVGTGGTGTFFINVFSRFLTANRTFVRNLYLIDGDTVEEKNIERQSFLKEDVGRPKSVVMAEALNEAFDLNWKAVDRFLLKKEQILDLTDTIAVPVLIGCVDNHACRLVLEKVFKAKRDIIYLDSANEFSSGEVVFGVKRKGRIISPCRSHFFKDILQGDKRDVTQMSCEELNNAAPQHIATNMMAGCFLLIEVCKILSGETGFGYVAFDTSDFSSEAYCREGVAA